MAAAPFDTAQGHRWFAIECNNEAWDLIELPSRTEQQTERMLHAAHAACLHWQAVGQPINELRAMCLLSTVYSAANRGDEAARYARRCVALAEQPMDGLTPFDQATAYGSAAAAARLTGDLPSAARFRSQALRFAAELPADDRAVFDKLYS